MLTNAPDTARYPSQRQRLCPAVATDASGVTRSKNPENAVGLPNVERTRPWNSISSGSISHPANSAIPTAETRITANAATFTSESKKSSP